MKSGIKGTMIPITTRINAAIPVFLTWLERTIKSRQAASNGGVGRVFVKVQD